MIALVLLAGCWPYIPGSYEDYVEDVDETRATATATRLFGFVGWEDYTGGYWDDAAAYGFAYAGWLPEPVDTYSAWDLAYVEDGCALDQDSLWLVDRAGRIDDRSLVLSASQDIELEFDDGNSLYVADLADEPDDLYDIDPFGADGATWSASDAVEVPSRLAFDQDLINGDEPQTVAIGDLRRFTWAARDDEGLKAMVELSVVAGSQVVEALVCAAPAGDGAIELDLGMLQEAGNADYVFVGLSTAMETVASIGEGTSSRFLGMKRRKGAVYLE